MKEEVRLKLKKRLRNLGPKYRPLAEHGVRDNFISYFNGNTPASVRCVGGYYPIGSELNIMPVLEYLTGLDMEIGLPVTVGDHMEFMAWRSGDRLYKNGNLFEPRSRVVKPDLLIVPLLGFDRSGNRLGYGKGFYDRYIKLYNPLVTIGVAFSVQEVKEGIPVEGHDERLDFIMTERELIIALDALRN